MLNQFFRGGRLFLPDLVCGRDLSSFFSVSPIYPVLFFGFGRAEFEAAGFVDIRVSLLLTVSVRVFRGKAEPPVAARSCPTVCVSSFSTVIGLGLRRPLAVVPAFRAVPRLGVAFLLDPVGVAEGNPEAYAGISAVPTNNAVPETSASKHIDIIPLTIIYLPSFAKNARSCPSSLKYKVSRAFD